MTDPQNEAHLADRAVETLAEEWVEQGGNPLALLVAMNRFTKAVFDKACEDNQ